MARTVVGDGMLLLGVVLALLGIAGLLGALRAATGAAACRRCGHVPASHEHYTTTSWCAHRGCECPAFHR